MSKEKSDDNEHKPMTEKQAQEQLLAVLSNAVTMLLSDHLQQTRMQAQMFEQQIQEQKLLVDPKEREQLKKGLLQMEDLLFSVITAANQAGSEELREFPFYEAKQMIIQQMIQESKEEEKATESEEDKAWENSPIIKG